jgi:cellulose synthase/poly-beta-1,6-N-acetylglucosamine synthase-like glycosyltransferase
VVVVDGGSKDKTVNIAKRNDVSVILAPGRNMPESRNIGSARSHGEILVQLDADTHVDGQVIAEIVEACKDNRVVGGTCKVYPYDGNWYHKFHYALVSVVLRSVARIPYVVKPRVTGSIIFMKRKVFEKLGGYPSNPVAEDQNMAKMVSTLGKFVYVSTATAYTSMRRLLTLGYWRTVGMMYSTSVLRVLFNRTNVNTWEKVEV